MTSARCVCEIQAGQHQTDAAAVRNFEAETDAELAARVASMSPMPVKTRLQQGTLAAAQQAIELVARPPTWLMEGCEDLVYAAKGTQLHMLSGLVE